MWQTRPLFYSVRRTAPCHVRASSRSASARPASRRKRPCPALEGRDRGQAILFARQTCGFSLVEFLVGLAILSLGLTGLAALHNRTLQYLQDSAHRQRALILATDMAERITANSVAATAGRYTLAPGSRAQPIDCAARCEPNKLAQSDLAHWQRQASTLLPNGEGTITRVGDHYSVTVTWHSLLSAPAASCPGAEAHSSTRACLRLEVAP